GGGTRAGVRANLPVGIEPKLGAEHPVTVEHAVHEFMKALWEAIAIVLAVSFISLGLRAGVVVALSIPLVLAMVFLVMAVWTYADTYARTYARAGARKGRPGQSGCNRRRSGAA